jgi:hypothetical protein
MGAEAKMLTSRGSTRVIVAVGAGATALAVLGGCAAAHPSTPSSGRPATSAPSSAAAVPSPSFTPVTSGALSFQILSARYTASVPNQYTGGSDGGAAGTGGYEVIYWRVTNVSATDTIMLNGSQTVANVCGRSTGPDPQAEDDAWPILWGASNPPLDQQGNIAPGQTVKAGSIFDVPAGCHSLSINMNDGSGSGQWVKLLLP